jgi:hypothetical protein
MSQAVNATDILTRLRAADPVDLAELERTVAPLRARIKQRAIEQGSLPGEPIPVGDRVAVEAGARRAEGGLLGRRRWPALGLASLACAAVLAAVIIFSGGSIDPVGQGTYPGFAEAAVKVAEANPRLLVTAPGWKVVDARSFKATRGQLYFADSNKQIYLDWAPAANYQEVDAKSRPRDGQVSTSTIAGRTATTIHEERGGASSSYFQTIFPPEGGVFVSLQGAFRKRGEWERLMASVRSVGVDEWLKAMPAGILRPGAIAGELTKMLRGVPVPPGFDASSAVGPTQLTNSFQAAKNLTQAVTCGWVGRWSAARRSGDAAVATEAAEAMSGADHWPVLLRMVREKGYRGDTLPAPGYGWPTSIITIGHQMAAGHLERERVVTERQGQVTAEGFKMPRVAYPPDAVVCFPRSPGSH